MNKSYQISAEIRNEFKRAFVKQRLMRELRALFVGATVEDLDRILIVRVEA